MRTAWGSPSLVAAARNLLSFALADDSRNEFFALLSDSCVPLWPLPYMHAFLFTSKVMRQEESNMKLETGKRSRRGRGHFCITNHDIHVRIFIHMWLFSVLVSSKLLKVSWLVHSAKAGERRDLALDVLDEAEYQLGSQW